MDACAEPPANLFLELLESGRYVDRTLLVRDMVDTNDRGIYLYLRSQRSGKTVNLSMLDAFFNQGYQGND